MVNYIIKRSSSWKICLSYVVYWLIFVYSINIIDIDFQKAIVSLYGGIPLLNTAQPNIIFGVMKWLLCILPPIIVSMLFINDEIGKWSVYTIIRSKNMNSWYSVRVLGIIVNNILYFIFGIAVIYILNPAQTPFSSLAITSLVLFPFYTIMISILCALFFIVTREQKSTLVIIALIVFSICFGSSVPSISKYMIGCIGMGLQSSYYNAKYGFNTFISLIALIFLIVTGITLTIVRLKKINPAQDSSFK